MRGDLSVVQDWLTAVDDEAVNRLEALSHEEVEIVGPRGQGLMDRRVLGEWFARFGFRSRPLRWFCGADGRIVVEHAAQWHDVATGAPQDARVIGSEFVVRAGRVARYVRHDSGVTAALNAAGLEERRDFVTGRA